MVATDPAVAAPPVSTPARTWLPGIEALRGVAAVTVVLHHSWSLSTMPRFPGYWAIEGFGTWGVDLFFLLSGFLLADYFWQPRERRSTASFYVRRFFRIAPAYYVNMFVLFLFFADSRLLFGEQGLRQVLANVTFTHYLWPGTSSSFNVNGAMWTLTIEILLYLCMPVMALLMARRPALSVMGFAAIGLGWRFYVALSASPVERWWFGADNPIPEGIKRLYLQRQFIGTLPIFALGMGVKWLIVNRRLPAWVLSPVRRPSVLVILLLLVPSILMLRGVERASNFVHPFVFSLFDPLFCVLLVPALLYAAKPVNTEVRRGFSLAVWMGERSYGLYLWHFPIILSVYGRGSAMLPPQLSHIALRLAVIYSLSLVAAAASYSMVEHPAREYGRRLSQRISRARRARLEVRIA